MSRGYTEREKARALALVKTNGGNVQRAAREAGVPRKTVGDWVEGKGVSQEAKRMSEQPEVTKELAAKFKQLAHLALDAITPEKLAKASLKELALAAAIFTDKNQLLTGSPTQIVGTEQLSTRLDAVALKAYEKAIARGERVTLAEVKQRMAEKYPDLKPYLRMDGGGSPSH